MRQTQNLASRAKQNLTEAEASQSFGHCPSVTLNVVAANKSLWLSF